MQSRGDGGGSAERWELGRRSGAITAIARHEEADGLGGDSLAPPRETESLGGRGLQADAVLVYTEGTGDVSPHGSVVGRHLRMFGDNRCVDGADPETLASHHVGDLTEDLEA